MEGTKRGKPQKWSDEKLKKLALDIKYKQPNRKLTSLLLEKETGIGRNTWSRRMKGFINQLNSPVEIPELNKGGIITVPSVEELFLKYGANTIELKNEIAKLLNIISDLYDDAKQLQKVEESAQKMELELQRLKEQLSKTINQKSHFESLYNQIIAESYFPHLYGRSEKLVQSNIKAEIIPLPPQREKALDLDSPYKVFQKELNSKTKQDTNISELNKMFNLDLE